MTSLPRTVSRSDGEDRRRKHVAIVGINYAPEQSGIAPYTTAVAERLAATGYKVTAVTGMPHYHPFQCPARQAAASWTDASIDSVRHSYGGRQIEGAVTPGDIERGDLPSNEGHHGRYLSGAPVPNRLPERSSGGYYYDCDDGYGAGAGGKEGTERRTAPVSHADKRG